MRIPVGESKERNLFLRVAGITLLVATTVLIAFICRRARLRNRIWLRVRRGIRFISTAACDAEHGAKRDDK